MAPVMVVGAAALLAVVAVVALVAQRREIVQRQ